jgi:peptidyl-prolyl cis-trans isomerase C
MKSQIPVDKKKEFEKNVRMRMIEGFVSRTLLAEEIGRKKITVTSQEINDEINKIKSSLPPGTTMGDFLKKNKINQSKMNEDIKFAIQINKLVTSSMKGKVKPSDKEIEQFYQKNKEKFKRPESAHARHILIAKAAGDDGKANTEKKNKAEALRKQLIDGADFAELAKQNSDCPSKQNGGDLGVFAKGQMVKPFENAAFSQKIKEIGPVVETDFGYHIIQVLERKPEQIMDLDNTVKGRITSIIEQQKLQEAFAKLMKGLKEKAIIKVHEKI